MSKGGLITLLGFLLAIMPFLGIPSLAKVILAVVFGFLVMALGFLVREERTWLMRAVSGDHEKDSYTENRMPRTAASAEVSQDYVLNGSEHSA